MKLLLGFDGKEDTCKILDNAVTQSSPNASTNPVERTKTDVIMLFIFAACVISFLPLLIYTLNHSDVNRLKGYDKCGDVCGQKNIKYDQWECSGKDLTDRPRLHYSGQCIPAYSWDVMYGYYNDETTVYEKVSETTWKLFLASLIPLGMCLVLAILFRYIPAMIVGSVLFIIWMSIFALLGYFAVIFIFYEFTWFVSLALFIAMVMLVYILVGLRQKIRLVTLIFKESARAIVDIKMTFCISIMVLIISSIIIRLLATTTIHMLSAGILTPIGDGYLKYIKNVPMVAALILNFVITWWVIQILLGAQFMTMSGAVAKWYFTRNQGSPKISASESLTTTLRYHLGTVTLGSVMIMFMAVPRDYFKHLAQVSSMKRVFGPVSRFMDGYFSKNTYITTAMHGTSFFRSGKKTVELLSINVGNLVDVNSFGNVIIFFCEILVVFSSLFLTYVLFDVIGYFGFNTYYFVYIIAISLICCYTILGPIKAAYNTIFLCVCQDFLNDKDVNEAYTMNVNKFLDTSYDLFAKKVRDKGLPLASENRNQNISA